MANAYLDEVMEEAKRRGLLQEQTDHTYKSPSVSTPIDEDILEKELAVRDEVKKYNGMTYQGIPLSQYRTGSIEENQLTDQDIEDITNNLVGEQNVRNTNDPFLTRLRKAGANTVKGIQKFPIELGLSAFSDPVKTAKSLVDFFPDIFSTIDKAISEPNTEPTIQGIPRSEWTGKKITYSEEEIEEAKDKLFARPDALVLAALPLLKLRGGEISPKAFNDAVMKAEPTIKPKTTLEPEVSPKGEAVTKTETTTQAKPVEQKPVGPKQQTEQAELFSLNKKDVGLKNEELSFIRENTGLKELPETERKSFEQTLNEAKQQNLQAKALETATNVIETKRSMTDVEHAAMTIKAAELSLEYDNALRSFERHITEGNQVKAEFERGRAESILADIDKVTEASRISGTEAGRQLNVRRMFLNREDFSLSAVTRRAMAKKGAKLSEGESAEVRKLVDEHAKLQEKLQTLELANDELSLRLQRAEAEKIVESETIADVKKTAKKQKSVINQRNKVKEQLRELGFRVNDITGATSEGSILIGKLALTYIKEGINTLDGIVKAVQKDIPGVTEGDVYRGLTVKNKRRVQRAVNRAKETEVELKKQAKLMLDIESLEKGLEPKKESVKRKPDSDTVAKLKAKVKELRSGLRKTAKSGLQYEQYLEKVREIENQLDNLYRPLKKKSATTYSQEILEVKENLRDLREQLRIQDKLADINEQLRTGEFKEAVKIDREVSPELQRARAELSLAKREIRYFIEQRQPMTFKRGAVEAVNTIRSLKATADLSATLRQGGVPFASNVGSFPKRFGSSLKSTISENAAELSYQRIINDPLYYKAESSGLHITEQRGAMNMREENFMSNLTDKVPGVKQVVRASERHMVTYLNELRWKMFTDFLEKNPNATRTELSAWSDFINKATGRGDLGKFSAAANVMSLGLFAPRFFVSRFQTPYALLKNIKNPIVLKEVGKNFASAGALAMTALYVAEMNGAKVGKDPREADFGKIRYGDTRFDLFAGEQQPLRFIVRIGLAVTDRAGITGEDLLKKEKEYQLVNEMAKFLSYKVAPSLSLTSEIISGKTIMGEEKEVGETLINAAIPMIVQSTIEAYQRDGGKMAAAVAGAELLGVSASTYEDSQSKVRKEIRTLIDNEMYEEAQKLKLKWNNDNPHKRIVNVKSTLEMLYNEAIGKAEKSYYEHNDTLRLQRDIEKITDWYNSKVDTTNTNNR